MNIDTYPIVIVRIDDTEGGGFLALAPDLHGCMGDGDTQEAAVADLRSAMGEWIAEAQAEGLDIPAPGAKAEAARAELDALYNLLDEQGEVIERLEERVKSLRAATRHVLAQRTGERLTVTELHKFSANLELVAISDRIPGAPH